jgi:hypothetical protein
MSRCLQLGNYWIWADLPHKTVLTQFDASEVRPGDVFGIGCAKSHSLRLATGNF